MARKKPKNPDIWYYLGFLTGFLFLPFIFMEEWEKAQRRGRRR